MFWICFILKNSESQAEQVGSLAGKIESVSGLEPKLDEVQKTAAEEIENLKAELSTTVASLSAEITTLK